MEGRWRRMGLFVCLFVSVGEKRSFYMDQGSRFLMKYEHCIAKKDIDEEIIEYYTLNRGTTKTGGSGIVMT